MYEKQNFSDGSVLTAEQLNHMETGIAEAHDALPKKLPAPATATVGDYLRISAVNTDGSFTVEAVPAPTVPTKVSELTNDAGYQTEAQVNALLAAFPTFDIQVVAQLPAEGVEKTIYLVPFADDSGSYLEYLWVNGAWEVVGSGKDSGENVTDAVRYTVQELTPEQKAQARINIGAAPAEEEEAIATVTGDRLLITDCSGGNFKGLSIYGATYQVATPSEASPQELLSEGMGGSLILNVSNKNLLNVPYYFGVNPYTKNGVTYTPNADGSVTVKGTATGGNDYRLNNFSGHHTHFSSSYNAIVDTGPGYHENLGVAVRDCVYQHYTNRDSPIAYISGVATGETADKTYYPQIEFGDAKTKFESPVAAQNITIATPGGLKGVPVTTGWTYVDTNGQAWIADEIDLGAGVLIQRIGQIDSYAGEAVGTNYLSTTGALTTGATVLYVLDAPVRTALNDAVISAFAGLTTHSPNTSVYVTQEITNSMENLLNGAAVAMRVAYTPIAEEELDEDKISEIAVKATAFDPTPYGLPMLYLSGDTTGMTKDDAVTLEYVYGDLSGTCTCKWQGSSSVSWAKKNYTIKFDQEFEAAEGWGAQKKYCFKANFIDTSHARNIVNAKLWGQIVKSRATPNETLNALPNGGAIDGFPCVIMLNGEFHGLYTWNIPKDGWMFGMGEGAQEAIVCADSPAGDPCGFKAATATFTDFSLEYAPDEDNADWILTSLNQCIAAVVNSDGTDLDTTVAQYLDWDSAIDYFIFTSLVGGGDMYRKNYILATYDGVKWFFSAYDMDTTHGLNWKGNGFNKSTAYPFMTQYNHRVMELIQIYKKDEVKARYAELRKSVMSEDNLYMEFTNWAAAIPLPIMVEDVRKWPTIPSSAASNVAQILNFYRMRAAFIDADIEKL